MGSMLPYIAYIHPMGMNMLFLLVLTMCLAAFAAFPFASFSYFVVSGSLLFRFFSLLGFSASSLYRFSDNPILCFLLFSAFYASLLLRFSRTN